MTIAARPSRMLTGRPLRDQLIDREILGLEGRAEIAMRQLTEIDGVLPPDRLSRS